MCDILGTCRDVFIPRIRICKCRTINYTSGTTTCSSIFIDWWVFDPETVFSKSSTGVEAKVIAKSECINTFDTSTWESTIYFFKSYQKVIFSYEMEK